MSNLKRRPTGTVNRVRIYVDIHNKVRDNVEMTCGTKAGWTDLEGRPGHTSIAGHVERRDAVLANGCIGPVSHKESETHSTKSKDAVSRSKYCLLYVLDNVDIALLTRKEEWRRSLFIYGSDVNAVLQKNLGYVQTCAIAFVHWRADKAHVDVVWQLPAPLLHDDALHWAFQLTNGVLPLAFGLHSDSL